MKDTEEIRCKKTNHYESQCICERHRIERELRNRGEAILLLEKLQDIARGRLRALDEEEGGK